MSKSVMLDKAKDFAVDILTMFVETKAGIYALAELDVAHLDYFFFF